MRAMFNRKRTLWLAMSAGTTFAVLEGCDPTVRETVLGGVESAASGLAGTFIQAFFQSLMADEEGAATTVQAIVADESMLFA